MHITSLALTHPGLRRESNEDSFGDRPALGFWVVCDGMGGHAAGEVASRVAVDAIEGFIQATDGADGTEHTWPFGLDPELGVQGTRLVTAFRLANRAIDTRMQDDPTLRGMATTAVAVLLQGGTHQGYLPALVAHVGDSRAYLCRNGQLSRLTRDHSWIEEQIAAGLLDEEDARAHPWRNLVTRALTGGGDPLVEITPVALERGDRLLLCSDGLTTAVADEVIADVVGRRPKGEVESICHTLIDAANAAGGPDNITVVLLEVDQV
jgi:protein phosphatase